MITNAKFSSIIHLFKSHYKNEVKFSGFFFLHIFYTQLYFMYYLLFSSQFATYYFTSLRIEASSFIPTIFFVSDLYIKFETCLSLTSSVYRAISYHLLPFLSLFFFCCCLRVVVFFFVSLFFILLILCTFFISLSSYHRLFLNFFFLFLVQYLSLHLSLFVTLPLSFFFPLLLFLFSIFLSSFFDLFIDLHLSLSPLISSFSFLISLDLIFTMIFFFQLSFFK